MDTRQLGQTDLHLTPIGFGAWAIGGGAWVGGWGSQDDSESIGAIHRALDLGINWIDTAPAYGLGRSEQVVARALKGRSERPCIFTKCAIRWRDDRSLYNSLTGASVREEIENSLRRLEIDVIDLYQIHWPDPQDEIEEAWSTMADLQREGKVRYIGVSNFSVEQMRRLQAIAPIASLQPPYSLVKPQVEDEILPFCLEQQIGVIVYSPMMSGLLTGKMTRERIEQMPDDDWRKRDAEFQEPRLSQNLRLVEVLRSIGERHGRSPGEVAIAWTLRHPAVTGAIVGARRPSQIEGTIGAADFRLSRRSWPKLSRRRGCVCRWQERNQDKQPARRCTNMHGRSDKQRGAQDTATARSGGSGMIDNQVDLVCVSHLWWDWVWQRPQHLLSRLAQQGRVLYVEEPRIQIGPEYEGFDVIEARPGLDVARLSYRSDAPTFWQRLQETLDRTGAHPFKVSDQIREASLLFESPVQERLEREVAEYVAARRGERLVLWLYTPVVVQFIDLLQPDLVVYDVMDELAAFKFTPPRLKQQEQELFARADLVFTGGPSLYEARRNRHTDVHLFPSGVEQAHFAQALSADLPLPDQLAGLPHPIIGFFGVIDERIDRELLAQVAALRPDWQWVMLGPILKLQERDLPRLPNLHYLGKQDYADLPTYLKAFDVAMMPFARNESTQFISPTKTLEYMAAHKPIVSTPITDVIGLYGSVVRIAHTPEEFVAQVDAALHESESERANRMLRERDLLGTYAWDRIASEMQALIDDRLHRKLALEQQVA